MQTEVQWQADRANLYHLHHQHPEWSRRQLASASSRSLSWVKKWLKRFRQSLNQSLPQICWSKPHRPKPTPPPPPNPVLVSRILEIRDHPPANLKRTPGPKAILYYLSTDPVLRELGLKIPASTSFIWKILDLNHRIARPQPKKPHQPLTRPEPLSCWQLDFKDGLVISTEPDGKKAHLIEILDVVDEGSSVLVAAEPSENYNAETALERVIELLGQHGVPKQVTFDRDPRWVGSHTGRDFPSAFVRFWYSLGVKVKICPPHRPDLNCYVERYHRAYGSECLAVLHPQTLGEFEEVTPQYQYHYNWERPNQSSACHNQPPRVAFPTLPALPALPLSVDPDKWLEVCHGQHYVRKVDWRGTIRVDKAHYYLKKELAGKHVQVELDGAARQLVVKLEQQEVKRLAIKGLYGGELAFGEYAEQILREARSERRVAELRARAKRNPTATTS